MYRIHIYSDSFFPTFFPCPDSVIAPSDSDPERCDDYETETEFRRTHKAKKRKRKGRGRARGGRPLRSNNTDPPPELEQPDEIPKQESPPNSVPLGIGQTVSSLPLNI